MPILSLFVQLQIFFLVVMLDALRTISSYALKIKSIVWKLKAFFEYNNNYFKKIKSSVL